MFFVYYLLKLSNIFFLIFTLERLIKTPPPLMKIDNFSRAFLRGFWKCGDFGVGCQKSLQKVAQKVAKKWLKMKNVDFWTILNIPQTFRRLWMKNTVRFMKSKLFFCFFFPKSSFFQQQSQHKSHTNICMAHYCE